MKERFWQNGAEIGKPIWPERGALYGDGLFETMALVNGRVALFDLHLERLHQDASYLGIEVPDSLSFEAFQQFIKVTEFPNRDCASLNLHPWREAGGRYTPTGNRGIWLLRYKEQPVDQIFPRDPKALKIGMYRENHKASNQLSQIKSNNSLLYVMASVFAEKNGFDDVLILNDQGRFIESSRCNLFLLIDDHVYTPPLESGCLNGVMRQWTIKQLEWMGIDVQYKSFEETDIYNASEIWLTNALRGFQAVSMFDGKEYGNIRMLDMQRRLIEFATKA